MCHMYLDSSRSFNGNIIVFFERKIFQPTWIVLMETETLAVAHQTVLTLVTGCDAVARVLER